MSRLRPFFSYYGSKWFLGRHYPAPTEATIVEPFAGSAGYALNYPARDVVLVDSDATIAGLWAYLIAVKASEVLALPLGVESVDDVKGPPEARDLVGFWLGRCTSSPRRSLSKWGRDGRWPSSFWGERTRARIAHQVERIRHWRVTHGGFESAPAARATWFVDPPYERQGRHYRSVPLNYPALAGWCRGLSGQVIVCENEGATWLPFEAFRTARANSSRGNGRVSKEVIWRRPPTNQEPT